MATPTVALFSRITREPSEILARLEGESNRLNIRIVQVGKLGVNLEGEMSFQGGETCCNSMKEAMEITASWADFAVEFLGIPLKKEFYIYFWKNCGSWLMSMELPSPCALFYSEEYEEGEWLRELLVTVITASGATTSAFGRHYDDELFKELDVTKILIDLRDGTLFGLGDLSFHIISEALVGTKEMLDILARFEKDMNFRYHLTFTGYHVFDTLGGPV